MTIRNLDKLLNPASVALIGASARPGSIGNTVARNLLHGGFTGLISLVNPNHSEIDGVVCHASVGKIDIAPDLAVIATPPATIPAIAAELAARGTKAITVISAGVTRAERQAILDAGKSACLRVLGPNCIGLLVPPIGLNASFTQAMTKPGKLAFLSQSGALVTAVIDWAVGRGIGFSHIISLGDMADVDFGDLIDYLAGDPGCGAILMYIEAITDARKFVSAARRAARVKPVIAIKSGRHATAARAAASHTGALAGSDAAYSAAFRRAGVLRVTELHELFDAAEMIASVPVLKGERLAIVTNGGGAGVLATDSLADLRGVLAPLAPDTMIKLDALMPSIWSHGNPVDIIGDADASRYTAALGILISDPNTDAVLVMNCPTALSSNTDIARAVVASSAAKTARKVLLTNWLGADSASEARRVFHAASIPTFETPAAAVSGFMQLVRHKRAQDALMRTPPPPDDVIPIDRGAADVVIAKARAAGRNMLSEPEAKAILAAYGIPVVETQIAETPAAAAEVARELLKSGSPVVLKILSDDISHKSDVGGVKLGLGSPEAVTAAARQMLEDVKLQKPDARLRGFTVSPFVTRPKAHELILGITEDQTFGPLVLFGAGGTAVEVMADTALALPPLDLVLASDLMRETRVYRLLQGYRDRPAANIAAIGNALVRLSALAANHPEIRELDINPLLADARGVVALDARVRLGGLSEAPRAPMAIRPYPAKWQTIADIAGLGRVLIRPIRPEDETLYGTFFEKVTMQDRRLRLFTPTKHLTHGFLARMTQIDYAREIAFVAVAETGGQLLGVVRYAADPDLRHGEFAVLVRSDLKGHGLGQRLMQQLVDYAKAEHLEALTGMVLEENTVMLNMCEAMGFKVSTIPGDPGVKHVKLRLRPDAA
jgi:acetyltransferase